MTSGRILSASYVGRLMLFSLVFTVSQGFLQGGSPSLLSELSNFAAGLLLALVLGSIVSQLPFESSIRVAAVWLALFVVQEFSNLVEGFFFTTFLLTISIFLTATLVGLLLTLVEALLAVLLFVPEGSRRSFSNEIKSHFEQRSWLSWTLRILVASLVYFPIYFTFGALISPFVLPYYTSSSLGLRIPSFSVMIPLEFVRGFLYVLSLLPILAVLKVGRKFVYARTASLLYVAGALVPFLVSPTLPVQLRLIHGVEILGDCIVYGAALAYLLVSPILNHKQQ